MWSELFWPYIGGAEQFGARLIRSLQQRGHEFLVVTSHDNLDLPDHDTWTDIEIRRLPMRTAIRGRSTAAMHRLRRTILDLKRRFNPDAIHVNAIGPSAWFHLHTEREWRVPSLVRLQQEVLPSQAARRDSLLFRALSSACWVVACADAILNQARHLVPAIAECSSTIRNGVSNIPDTPVPMPAGVPRLVCAGRLVPAKGFENAISALALLVGRYPWLRLDIAGDGVQRSALEQQVRDLDLGEAVRFLGWKDPADVPDVLKGATIVLVPSNREGLPAVAVQASVMSRPIIASSVGGLPEIVVDGETGFLVPRRDPAALAAAVGLLLDQPELARRFGLAGYERARALFDWSACVDQYEALYHTLDRRQ